jgi:magnesium transporter
MTPRYIAVFSTMTTQEVIEKIRKRQDKIETANVIYMVDTNWILEGVVSLKDVVLAKPDTLVKELSKTDIYALQASQDREQAVEMMEESDLMILPVVDQDGTLVGIVTADDVLDVVAEETTEDFHK